MMRELSAMLVALAPSSAGVRPRSSSAILECCMWVCICNASCGRWPGHCWPSCDELVPRSASVTAVNPRCQSSSGGSSSQAFSAWNTFQALPARSSCCPLAGIRRTRGTGLGLELVYLSRATDSACTRTHSLNASAAVSVSQSSRSLGPSDAKAALQLRISSLGLPASKQISSNAPAGSAGASWPAGQKAASSAPPAALASQGTWRRPRRCSGLPVPDIEAWKSCTSTGPSAHCIRTFRAAAAPRLPLPPLAALARKLRRPACSRGGTKDVSSWPSRAPGAAAPPRSMLWSCGEGCRMRSSPSSSRMTSQTAPRILSMACLRSSNSAFVCSCAFSWDSTTQATHSSARHVAHSCSSNISTAGGCCAKDSRKTPEFLGHE
mmetsp:Transcript_77945/g.242161  ORF Transcript_77945/g.242161 Transcript_77945/m.242161 type:complete len:379 (+) Transcript_77945:150-1286(+)